MSLLSLFPAAPPSVPGSPVGNQWLRKAELVVTPATGNQGLDLSDMHFTFEVTASDTETPNIARIRVYNLLPATANKIQNEYSGVILSAGYQTGAFGTIFKGQIKQVGRGRSSPTDTYLDLACGDYDPIYNFSFMNQTLAAGASPADRGQAIVQQMTKDGLAGDDGSVAKLTGGILPRGKVMFGMARLHMRQLATTTSHDWSIQKGVLQMVPKTGVKPGQVTIMNSQTGMIGMPEQTNDGILVRCLLNPSLSVGNLLRINNADINQTQVRGPGFPSFTDTDSIFIADLARDDGDYRIFVVEYRGDTRGNPWYSEMTCLVANGGAVKLYG